MTYDFRAIPGYRLAELATAGTPSGVECQAMLKATRKTHGLTQGAMSYLLGVHIGNIREWEGGRRCPNAATRKRIIEVCRALDESV